MSPDTANRVVSTGSVDPRRPFTEENSYIVGGSETARSDSTINARCHSTCAKKVGIIGCDNRFRGPTSRDEVKGVGPFVSPFRQVGRIGGCTGTLIGDRYVLTAAHCLVKKGKLTTDRLSFVAGQFDETGCGKPYGTQWARRVFIPTEYTDSITKSNKASDWAVVELDTPPNIGKRAIDIKYLPWSQLTGKDHYSIGYPSDKNGGTVWLTGLSQFVSPASFFDGGDRGLFYVNDDATGGQSGSPIYVWRDGLRKIVGVLIGSPQESCKKGHNWAPRLMPRVIKRIENAMDPRVIDVSMRILTYPEVPDPLSPPSCVGNLEGS